MKKIIWIVAVVIVIILAAGIYFSVANAPKKMPAQQTQSIQPLQNLNVKAGDTVASPLHITGQAPGTWYFEASFPVKIYDANGQLLGNIPAQAQSDWMTENLVPFATTLTFSTSTTESGTLVLQNDNPSGRPESAKQIEIPVRFKR